MHLPSALCTWLPVIRVSVQEIEHLGKKDHPGRPIPVRVLDLALSGHWHIVVYDNGKVMFHACPGCELAAIVRCLLMVMGR